MVITVEVSLYPLKDDFEDPILGFINSVRANKELTVRTTAMSTYIKGEMSVVFDTLKIELQKVYQHIDTSSTVIKIVNRDLPIEDGYYKFSN